MAAPTANAGAAEPLSLVVLISGNGSNLQALLDAIARGDVPARVRAVVSNRAEAYGLQRAEQAGIPHHVLSHRDFPDRASYDAALQALIDRYRPGLVVLAGFMRILTAEFVNHYAGRLMNIHPSLLPAYQGLDTHRRALADGVKEHGASVHFVTEELDGGPVIIQGRVAVDPGDSAETLAEKVHGVEHRIYPLAVAWFAQGRLRLDGEGVSMDGRPLAEPILWEQ